MVSQPPTDTPFGLQANVAAGLAYLFGWVGGLIMLLGGGTNKSVKWAAAQSITISIGMIALYIGLGIVGAILHLWLLFGPLYLLLDLAFLGVFLWTTIFAFQGKDVEVPVVAGIAKSIFASML